MDRLFRFGDIEIKVQTAQEVPPDPEPDDGFIYAVLTRLNDKGNWWTRHIDPANRVQALKKANEASSDGYEVRVIRVPK